MNLEKRKNKRRGQILAAAEDLIRETNSTGFSMNALAARAGQSTPTTYNLIGSKSTVLYSLLNSYQDNVDMQAALGRRSRNAYLDVVKAADVAVSVYVTDANFVKPLLQFLIGVPEPVHRSAFMERGYRYWRNSFQGLVNKNVISDFTRNLLSRDFLIFFTGLIDFWVLNELSDDLFRASARHASLLRLAAIADAPDREKLLSELYKAERAITLDYTSG